MPSVTEYGYLGAATFETGTSRQPTVDGAGEPVYTTFAENVWANELLGPDGKARFMATGSVSAPNAAMHNFADELTVVALVRMRRQLDDFGAFINKKDASAGYNLSETGSVASYYVRVDSSGGTNQACGYNLAAMKKTLDQNWHWVAFSLNRGAYKSWLNGAPIHQTTYNHGTGLSSNVAFSVICNNSCQSQIACLMIFNRQLGDDEMAALIKGTVKPQRLTGLSGYYKFSEASGTLCLDSSGNANHMNYSQDASKLMEEFSPDGNICRQPSAAWYYPSGYSLAAGAIALNSPTVSTIASVATQQLQRGNSYITKFTISGLVGDTQVRLMLYTQDGKVGVGTTRAANGTYVETLTITGSGSNTGLIGIQAMNGTSVCTVSDISVIPLYLDSVPGLSGQPYVPRMQRNVANQYLQFFRRPPSILNVQAQGSIIAGAGSSYSAPDSSATRLAGDISIFGWIRFGGSVAATLWSKNTSEGRLDCNSGKTLEFSRNGFTSSIALPFTLPPNAWAFVGITFDSNASIVSFYVNATLVTTRSFSPGTPTFTTNPSVIGSVTQTKRPNQVRSIRVFSRVVTLAEIQTMFQYDYFPRTDPTMVVEFMCNEPWNNVVRDTSMYANHCSPTTVMVTSDSPYAAQRRKRKGKQIRLKNSQQANHSSTAFRAKLVGSRFLTVSCWVKTIGVFDNATPRFGFNMSTSVAGFIGAGNQPDGSPIGFVRSVETDSARTSPPVPYGCPRGKWSLVSLEIDYSAGVLKIWVDGVLRVSSLLTAFPYAYFNDSGNPQAIVSSSTPTIQYDAFRIYNRSLTSDEHFALFLDQAPRDSALVLEWLFDNDTAGITVDSSGNGFNGTTIGSPTYVSEL